MLVFYLSSYLLSGIMLCFSQTAANPDKSPEWLPPGWIVEEKTRMSGVSHGHTYKVLKQKHIVLHLPRGISY